MHCTCTTRCSLKRRYTFVVYHVRVITHTAQASSSEETAPVQPLDAVGEETDVNSLEVCWSVSVTVWDYCWYPLQCKSSAVSNDKPDPIVLKKEPEVHAEPTRMKTWTHSVRWLLSIRVNTSPRLMMLIHKLRPTPKPQLEHLLLTQLTGHIHCGMTMELCPIDVTGNKREGHGSTSSSWIRTTRQRTRLWLSLKMVIPVIWEEVWTGWV